MEPLISLPEVWSNENEPIREYFFKCVMDLATAPALHNLPAS
ncbi:hypothetical protein NXV33_18990 [Bacteroides thetaiotaomicron]|nr:hypothetical protein [Bacteroides thetaiotaomicron]